MAALGQPTVSLSPQPLIIVHSLTGAERAVSWRWSLALGGRSHHLLDGLCRASYLDLQLFYHARLQRVVVSHLHPSLPLCLRCLVGPSNLAPQSRPQSLHSLTPVSRFYATHRLLHESTYLWNAVHREHHAFKEPSAFAQDAVHPFEAILQVGMAMIRADHV